MPNRTRSAWLTIVAVSTCLMACGSDVTGTGDGREAEHTARTSSAIVLGQDNQWTWYPLPGTVCGDGSQTGIAVNPLSAANGGNGKVLMFMDGGGMCSDNTSCNILPTITHKSYGATDWAAEYLNFGDGNAIAPFTWSKPRINRGIFDRTSAANPFRSYNFVFLPYCTGDLHQGNRLDTSSTFRVPSGMNFRGAANFWIDAGQVWSSWPSTPAIVLVGESAGGFGAYFSYLTLRAIFPSTTTHVTVLSDSSVPFWTGTLRSNDHTKFDQQGYWLYSALAAPAASFEEDYMADAWGLDSTRPSSVAGVSLTSNHLIYPQQSIFFAATAVTSVDKFAVLSSTDDRIIPNYLHLQQPPASPSVSNNGLGQFQSAIAANNLTSRVKLYQISSTATYNSALAPWYQHHTFVLDDVAAWSGAQGSSLSTILSDPFLAF